MYLRKVMFASEKKDSETRKIVRLQFLIAPFSNELASELGQGIKAHLFRMDTGEPIGNLDDAKFKVINVTQTLRIKLAADIPNNLVRQVENVKVEPTFTFRRDKETPTIEAKFWCNFTYPEPEMLLFLANQQNEQIVCSFLDTQEELPAEKETKRARKARTEPKLDETPDQTPAV